MAWIESHQELGRHPKTRRLARLLGVSMPAAVGHLQFFWWWALDYAQEGRLDRFTNGDISDACMWEGEPEKIVLALEEAEFIEKDSRGKYRIHDWKQYAGKLIEARKADAARKKRDRNPEDVQRISTGRRSDGGRNSTVPNRTKHNRTEPEPEAPAPEVAAEPSPAQQILDHWNVVWSPSPWPRPKSLTDTRRSHINARLEKFTVEELCAAIDHLHSSPHHIGQNDRGWVADPDWLFKNDEHVERFIEPAVPAMNGAHAPPGFDHHWALKKLAEQAEEVAEVDGG